MSDRTALRIGAFGAIAGGVLLVLGNVLHPREAGSLDSVEGFLAEVSGSSIFVPDHLMLMAGIALLLPALYGLARSMSSEGAREWAKLAWAAAIVGVGLGMVLIITDGLAVSSVARQWAAASQKELAVTAATGVVAFYWAVFTGLMLFTFGAVPVLYGVAMLRGDDYAAWLGWVGVLFGVLSVVAGAIQIFRGAIPLTAYVLFPIAAFVLTAWLIFLGVLMYRRASSPAP